MLNIGIRSQEMRALTVDKVNFNEGIITIDKAVKRTGELGKPKNGKTRYIPIKPEVLEFLQAKINKEAKYILGDSDYITASALRCYYEAFIKRLNNSLAEKGEKPIPVRSPHILRHTCGTLLQKNGMPIAILMEIMGHKSREMTDHYTHVGDIETLTEAVKKYRFLS